MVRITPEEVKKLRNAFKEPHHTVTTHDGLTLFIREWKPPSEKDRKKAVLIFHGITAYSGPYAFIAEPMAAEGYTVFGMDYRGHGLSDGNRGDCPSAEHMKRDITTVIKYITDELGYGKVIIMGHSLGVAVAVLAYNSVPDKIAGLILLSAARKVNPDVYPKLSLRDKLRILFNSIFRPSKQVIKYYRDGLVGLDDPLFNFDYTLRFLKMLRPDKLGIPEKVTVPVLVAVGDRDELFSVDAVKEVYEEIPAEDKTFLVIKGGKHAEFPSDCAERIIDWLNSKFGIEKGIG